MVTLRRRQVAVGVLLAAVWGVALGVLVNVYLRPSEPPLSPLAEKSIWITTATSLERAYFRREWQLPERPVSAWIAVAAEHYDLYVNDTLVGSNEHVFNAGLAFQSRISDHTQRLTRGLDVKVSRAPTAFLRANREWGVAQVYEIGNLLKPGRNVIAIFVADPQGAKFKTWGGAVLSARRVTLDSGDWRFAAAEEALSGGRWFSHFRLDDSWERAVRSRWPERPILSRIPLECWTIPFQAASVLVLPGEIPGSLHRFTPARSLGRSVWLRLVTTRPVDIAAGGVTLFTGKPSAGLVVVDVSQYADLIRHGFEVRFSEVTGRLRERPTKFAVDVISDGRMVPLFAAGDAGQWSSSVESERVEPLAREIYLLPPNVAYGLATFLRSIFAWTLAAAVFCLLLFSATSRNPRTARATTLSPIRCLALSAPALVFLAAVELLRFRLVETDTGLLFYSLPLRVAVVVTFTCLLLFGLSGALDVHGRLHRRSRSAWRGINSSWLLTALLVGAAALRISTLGVEPIQADEGVSWDAARGILRTGFPEAVSGVLYTRSPFYHYPLAVWLWLFGDNVVTARLFAVPWAVGTIYLTFLIARRVTGSVAAALLAAALIALDPTAIGLSGIIRFYQQLQFFSLLSVWCFIRGFIDRDTRYQHLFFVACTLGVLSQEVFVTLLPGLVTAFYLYYRPFSWREDRRIVVGFVTFLAITFLDIASFTFLCLTPQVGIASSGGSIMQLNLNDIVSFATTFFVGVNRSNILYAIAFFGSMLWVRRYAERERMVLFVMVLMTTATITLLVLQVAARYTTSIQPLLTIGAVVMLYEASRDIGGLFERSGNRWWAFRARGAVTAIVLAMLFLNLEPDKFVDAYSTSRILAHQYALEDVKRLRKPGDKIMSVYPMPAAIVFGGADYYLMTGATFDEIYERGDEIVDRWSGGKALSRVDQIRAVFDANPRIWILVDDLEKPKMAESVRQFLFASCDVQFEFRDGQVLLWDRSEGKYSDLVSSQRDPANTY